MTDPMVEAAKKQIKAKKRRVSAMIRKMLNATNPNGYWRHGLKRPVGMASLRKRKILSKQHEK